MNLRRLAVGLLVLSGLVVTWEPPGMAWTPSAPLPRQGPWADNDRLASVDVWSTDGRRGPEDVAVDAQGRVIAGTLDGTLLRWQADGSGPVAWVNTGGRPLGLAMAPDGRLLVADAMRGLLAVSEDGGVEVLLTEVAGRPLHFADDLDVTADGLVVLSDASDTYGFHDWKRDILDARPRGRLVTYDLTTGKAEELLDGLHFANGVAVSRDGARALVTETSRYRVLAVTLRGPDRGAVSTWIDGLPGFPDGISRSPNADTFWLAIPSPRNGLVDALAGWPRLRATLSWLPEGLQPAPVRDAMVVRLDEDGTVREVLGNPAGDPFSIVTSVQAHGDDLYLGSLAESSIAVLRGAAAP